jgi:hypothetical protein
MRNKKLIASTSVLTDPYHAPHEASSTWDRTVANVTEFLRTNLDSDGFVDITEPDALNPRFLIEIRVRLLLDLPDAARCDADRDCIGSATAVWVSRKYAIELGADFASEIKRINASLAALSSWNTEMLRKQQQVLQPEA